MTIRRRCTERNCKNGRRCLEHLRFDVMYRGKRYRVPANEFAIPRMDPGKQRPIQSMEEARDWERLFIGEVKAGRNPLRPRSRTVQAGADLHNVCAFLDAYLERCVKPAGLRSIAAVRSRVAVLKEHLGQLPLEALEEPDDIVAEARAAGPAFSGGLFWQVGKDRGGRAAPVAELQHEPRVPDRRLSPVRALKRCA